MTDEQVIQARRNAIRGAPVLAQVYGVPLGTMVRALKGLTYKHLNIDYPPQL